MLSEKNVRIILHVILFTALGTYILISELPQLWISEIDQEIPQQDRIVFLFKVGAMVISSFLILSSFKLDFLLRLVLGENYVAGSYSGYSEEIHFENSTSLEKHEEKLTITQTLISTKISGISLKDGVFYSKWNGRMVEAENGHIRFLVRLETPKGQLSGIMSLSIMGDELNGFAIVAETGEHSNWSFRLKKDPK